MFERYTEGARHVIVFALEEARALKHNRIGTEHLLMGLLREQEGLAAKALLSAGVNLEAVRNYGPKGDEEPAGRLPFTPTSKEVLELALREALRLGHNYIGTGHQLLGLLRDEEGPAMGYFQDAEIDLEKLRKDVTFLACNPAARWSCGATPSRSTP